MALKINAGIMPRVHYHSTFIAAPYFTCWGPACLYGTGTAPAVNKVGFESNQKRSEKTPLSHNYAKVG